MKSSLEGDGIWVELTLSLELHVQKFLYMHFCVFAQTPVDLVNSLGVCSIWNVIKFLSHVLMCTVAGQLTC